ncbi:DUF2189 domain-containing protein [Luteimonas sp. e5]
MVEHDSEIRRDAPTHPFVAPARELDMAAPWRWLRAGWRDMMRAPRQSVLFGALIVVVSVLVSLLAWRLGRFALLATLLSGFVFVAPLIAVGLYCVSRSLERGEEPRIGTCLALARRVLGQAAVFALAQGVIILLWSRAGMVITALSPMVEGDRVALLEYLAIGSVVGGIFAAFTFAVAAVSLPFIAERDVDMITAGISSVNAVLRNKAPMALWAAIIVLLTLAGFATAFIGLGLVMPWLAYASWHAYHDTLDTRAWEELA